MSILFDSAKRKVVLVLNRKKKRWIGEISVFRSHMRLLKLSIFRSLARQGHFELARNFELMVLYFQVEQPIHRSQDSLAPF